MSEPKTCPFCGRTPIVEDCGEHRYFIRCKCGIAQDKLFWQKCDAIRRWNTRKGKQNESDLRTINPMEAVKVSKMPICKNWGKDRTE